MTANAYREDVEHALEAGMNAHVAKPIDIGHLLSVLDECIKKGKAL
jgi:CheY-like chemotaxis protein